jgi:hypothetical protein
MFDKNENTGRNRNTGNGVLSLNNVCDHSALAKGHKRLKTGLDCLAKRLWLIENSWQRLNRKAYVPELMRMREKVVSFEGEIENINDPLVRSLGYEYIDKLASKRRFLLEEIRWDIASS